jgi:hypothetical protein
LAKKDNKIEVLHDCGYHTQKPWLFDKEDDIYKYKCVYTINSKNEPTFKYSSKKIHTNNPKIIWSNGRISSVGCYIDKVGEYGLTQFAYGIIDFDVNVLKQLQLCFLSKSFKNIMEYCVFKELSINYKIIALFRKDFYNHI